MSALRPANLLPTARTPESGLALMALAMMLVPVGDTLSKLLTETLNPFEIAFWRLAFQTLALALLVAAFTRRIRTGPWPLLLLGGFTTASILFTLIGAFTVMPIATAIAIFFVEPLLLTVLSALILKEKTGWHRYLAVMVGLLGALIVIRPNWAAFGWVSLLPLLAALSLAVNVIVIRKVSTRMDALSIQFWFSLIAALGLGAGLLLFGRIELVAQGVDPTGPWGMLMAMGLLSAVTFVLLAEAFRRTPASTLAPFQYLEIVGAVALGYLVFGDFPDLWTWVGTAVILGSGLYVFHRERRAGKTPPALTS